MTSLTPPSLDEIHEIVDRRRSDTRRRNRLAFTGTAVVVAAAAVAGIRTLADADVSGVADDGGDPTTVDTPKPRPAVGELPDPVADEERIDEEGADASIIEDTPDPGLLVDEAYDLFNYGAFYGAGYGYAQSTTLGEVWEIEPFQAKTKAGALIIAGRQADVTAIAGPPVGVDNRLDDFASAGQDAWEDDILLGAYWGAGYSVDQSLALAAAWDLDVLVAKADAGYDVLTGDTAELDDLIGAPSGTTSG